MKCGAEDCDNAAKWVLKTPDLLIVLCEPCSVDVSKELPLKEKMSMVLIRDRRL